MAVIAIGATQCLQAANSGVGDVKGCDLVGHSCQCGHRQYRIRHYGDYKNGWDSSIRGLTGTSRTFQVN